MTALKTVLAAIALIAAPLASLAAQPAMELTPAARPSGEFWKNWSLITIQHDGAKKEQHFIYANEIAEKALKSNATNFPDGAALVNVAYPEEGGKSKPHIGYQMMRKDAHLYRAGDGWGYAQWGADGKPAKPGYGTSCMNCHTSGKARDSVFTSILDSSNWVADNIQNGTLKFADHSATPDRPLPRFVPTVNRKVDVVEVGKITPELLDTIQPVLARQFSEGGSDVVIARAKNADQMVVGYAVSQQALGAMVQAPGPVDGVATCPQGQARLVFFLVELGTVSRSNSYGCVSK